jgi:hypothetical protein
MHRRSPSVSTIETLESRLLLSGVSKSTVITSAASPAILREPIALTVPLSVTGLAASAESRISLDLTPAMLLGAKVAHRLSNVGPTVSPSALLGLELSTLATTHNPLSAQPVPVGTIVLTSVTSGNVGLGADPPVILTETPNGALAVVTGVPAREGSSSEVTTSPVATGAVTTRKSTPTNQPSTQPASADSHDETTPLPAASHVVVDATQSSLRLLVPVGPNTQAVGLSVSTPSESGQSQVEEVEEISLIDANGHTLEQVNPSLDSQTDSPTDAITLALSHAPAGGSLVVQISAPVGGTTPSLSGSTNAGGGPVAFVVDVQRLDSSAVGPAAAAGSTTFGGNTAATGRASIGTLSWTSSSDDADSLGDTAATADTGPGAAASVVVQTEGNDGTAVAEPSIADASSPADFSGRIALGPLASRAAAPLGPNLATVMSDPAPSVDRYERALLQEIDEHETQTAEGPLARGVHEDDGGDQDAGNDQADAAEQGGRRDESFVAIAGLGALPLKVPATKGGNRLADLDALLAALPAASGGGAGPVVARDDDLDIDDLVVSLTAPASSQHDRRAAPDYLTSACILALGMGLTAGPLIPDLLRLIPSRSPRRRIAPAGPSRFAGGAGPGGSGFGHWLQRRIDTA